MSKTRAFIRRVKSYEQNTEYIFVTLRVLQADKHSKRERKGGGGRKKERQKEGVRKTDRQRKR